MSEEMKLIMALCEKLGFTIKKKATQESIKARAACLAQGCTFDPGLKYTYELIEAK